MHVGTLGYCLGIERLELDDLCAIYVSVLLSVLQCALYSFRERLAYFVARRTVINAQEIAQQVPGLCYSNRDGPSVTVLQG